MSRDARLAAKVKAVNSAHRYANELYTKLVKVFEPLVGKKVINADGGITQAVKKLMPELPTRAFGSELHVYQDRGGYSLVWNVKTCEHIEGDSGCLYYECGVYVGRLSGDKLESINAPNVYRHDYTVEGIKGLRVAHKKAEEAEQAARGALYPFGEVDR